MCPMCWATVLATYIGLLSISAVVVAGTDWRSLLLAAIVGGFAAAHLLEYAEIPWWCFVATGALLLVRLGYLLLRDRHQLLITRAWRMAVCVAKQRCPMRRQSPSKLTAEEQQPAIAAAS